MDETFLLSLFFNFKFDTIGLFIYMRHVNWHNVPAPLSVRQIYDVRGSVRLHGRLVEWARPEVIQDENLAVSVDILSEVEGQYRGNPHSVYMNVASP